MVGTTNEDVDSKMKVSMATLLNQLSHIRKAATLYPVEHEYVKESASELLTLLNTLFDEHSSVSLSILNDEVYFNGGLLAEESMNFATLIQQLSERFVHNITFEKGLNVNELCEFAALSCARPEAIGGDSGWQESMAKKGIERIAVNRTLATKQGIEGDFGDVEASVSRNVYRQTIEAALNAYVDARAKRSINTEIAEGVIGMLISSIASDKMAFAGLTQIKMTDEYTLSHSVNVAVLSLLMGSKLKMPGPLLHRLGVAALLHDIGKTQIPEEVINKPGKLSPEEWEMIQSHSLHGARILAEQKDMDQLAVVVAAEHHARVDLKGYPRFSVTTELHTLSKIVAIVDTYDALTSDRSYRRALLPDKAMTIVIQGAKGQFDLELLKAFVQLTGMYPVGTFVELDTGERGVVIAANSEDLYRPQVKLFADTDSGITEFTLVDAAEKYPDGTYKRTVVRSIEGGKRLVSAAGINI